MAKYEHELANVNKQLADKKNELAKIQSPR